MLDTLTHAHFLSTHFHAWSIWSADYLGFGGFLRHRKIVDVEGFRQHAEPNMGWLSTKATGTFAGPAAEAKIQTNVCTQNVQNTCWTLSSWARGSGLSIASLTDTVAGSSYDVRVHFTVPSGLS